MTYKKLLKALDAHAAEITDIAQATREGIDLKDACNRLFVTLGRTSAIVAKFDAEEQEAQL